jgi:hypothetical protein
MLPPENTDGERTTTRRWKPSAIERYLPAGAPRFDGAPALDFLPVWAGEQTVPALYVFGRPRATIQQ